MLQLLLIVSAPGAKRSLPAWDHLEKAHGTPSRKRMASWRKITGSVGERLLDQLIFFSSVVADLALRLGPDSGRSGKKKYKIYETLWLHKRGTSWLSQNKDKKHGNSDDPQISRPDLRFASRKTAKQHKTGPEPHQTKTTQIHGDCLQTR